MLRAEEPARRLGRVARVAVVGEQADERPLQLLVQSGEQKRQDRLGDAGTARQRAGELLEALVGANLVDEGVQYRTVHDERRDTRPAESSLGALAGPARMRGVALLRPRRVSGPAAFGGSSRARGRQGQRRSAAATHLDNSLKQTQRRTKSTPHPRVGNEVPPATRGERIAPGRDGSGAESVYSVPVRAQLKRACAASRPSRTTVSTASAARLTTASTSTSSSNGDST